MSKRKSEFNAEQDEEDDNDSRNTSRQQQPQKVYDFHKKTIEVYPERLHELNQQFLSSISSQIQIEPYSVLVGNCLDYVRQYFNYEDDLLQYSPWLATRLKQSRSDIVKCLQETIDVYEALARHDFDRIIEKNPSQISSNTSTINGNDNSIQTHTPILPITTTTTSLPLFNMSKTITTNSSNSDSTISTGFTFSKPTTNTTNSATSDSTPPSIGFTFKMPSATTASPEKTTNAPPFSFSLPNTGFGTSTFAPANFGTSTTTTTTADKLTASVTTPPKFTFVPIPSATGDQPGGTEDNDDEASEPPEPEKVEHETDAKLTYRCRMGVSKGTKLVKRGPVQVNLKEVNDKRQLIVRSDDTLGRLFLNILWSKLLKLEKNSTKDLTFACQLNPGMTEIKEGEFVKILFRFDNETDRNDAYEKLDKERS